MVEVFSHGGSILNEVFILKNWYFSVFLGSPEGCRLVENPKRQSLVGGNNGKSNTALF